MRRVAPDSAAGSRAHVLQSRPATYTIAGGCVLVLALLVPIFAHGWIALLLVVVLVIVGIEMIRNIVQREAETSGS